MLDDLLRPKRCYRNAQRVYVWIRLNGRRDRSEHCEKLPMDLGSFSISLAVQDLDASTKFYEKLGFAQVGGDADQNWLILRNRDHVIGLFQGMFESNILTFNPGWDQNGDETDSFADVREIQRELKARGIEMTSEVDETTSGPASLMLTDPDGNQILIDQHR